MTNLPVECVVHTCVQAKLLNTAVHAQQRLLTQAHSVTATVQMRIAWPSPKLFLLASCCMQGLVAADQIIVVHHELLGAASL